MPISTCASSSGLSSTATSIVFGNQLPVHSTSTTVVYSPRLYSPSSSIPFSGFWLGSSTSTEVYIHSEIYYRIYYQPSVITRLEGHYIPRAKSLPAKKPRSAIKKALKLLFDLGYEEEARMFLRGDTLEVSHPDSQFTFVLSKQDRNSLQRLTEHPGYSTPYNLSLYTKSGIYVSKLCVYMDNTPVLDQLLAILLFIKSGSEDDLLKKANYNSRLDDKNVIQQLVTEFPFLQSKLLHH